MGEAAQRVTARDLAPGMGCRQMSLSDDRAIANAAVADTREKSLRGRANAFSVVAPRGMDTHVALVGVLDRQAHRVPAEQQGFEVHRSVGTIARLVFVQVPATNRASVLQNKEKRVLRVPRLGSCKLDWILSTSASEQLSSKSSIDCDPRAA